MDVSKIFQYLSYFSAFIPVTLTFVYWKKLKFNFDFRINLIGTYLIFYFVIQFLMLLLSINGIQNLFLLRIFIVVEVFIFSFFVLSLQLKSRKICIFLSFAITIGIVLIDLIWGEQSSWPVESSMVEAIIITLLGMAAIPSIKIRRDYQSSYFHFTFAILFTSVNTLLGVGFLDLAPALSFNIQAIVAITSFLIFAWGFYVIFKSESEIKKQQNDIT